MSAHVPALPLEADPLIAEAKQRARRRRLIAALALLAAGGVVGGVLAFGAGGSFGEVPWLPTRPQLGPANPPLAPACRASQLRAKVFLQGGGFGRLIGPLEIANRGPAPCALVGMPTLSFAGATSRWQLARGPSLASYDPLTPSQTSLRALPPGRWAATYLTWSNWCGRGSNYRRSTSGLPPRAFVITAPGGGRIQVRNDIGHGEQSTPNCDGPGMPSRLAASRFSPIVPQGPPSSALPLAARIVATGQAPVRGSSLSYTVVLKNRSAKPFSFGRACPAYEEGFGLRPAAYILNCHGVGPIAPHASVSFAMRVAVPRHGATDTLNWNLAPHSWGGGPLASRNLRLR